MRFGRCREEGVDDIFKQIQSCLSDWFTQRFDFFLKFLKFEGQNALEDSSSLVVMGESEVNDIELALDSFADFSSTTTRRTHGTNELDVQNELEELSLLSIEPSVIVYPLSHQLERWLGTERVFPGHVQVVDENHHLFPVWNHLCFCPSHELHFDHFLRFERICLSAEHDVH